MDSHLLIIGDTKDFEATKEELQKLYDLQLMLKGKNSFVGVLCNKEN